jgi:hypothetical protein
VQVAGGGLIWKYRATASRPIREKKLDTKRILLGGIRAGTALARKAGAGMVKGVLPLSHKFISSRCVMVRICPAFVRD